MIKEKEVSESGEEESEGMKTHMKTQVHDIITIKAHHHQSTAVSVIKAALHCNN